MDTGASSWLLLFLHLNWLFVCDVSCRQVLSDLICITEAYEVVSCAEMYAVRGRE